jgi:mono/diheme cytochrome c family protein
MRRDLLRLVAATAMTLTTASVFAGDYAELDLGRYLVQAGDCQSCHTDANGAPFAGARAIPTPFGIIYSRNITPDTATGIGGWSDEDFYRALHEGISRDGSHLYPAFPYPWYTRLSRVDVAAIKSYLDTVTPVRQIIPPNKLNWPLNWRSLVAVWNKLFFDEGEFHANADKSPEWNRGAYLVEGAGHCSACHSPKNILGAVKKHDAFEGGEGENWLAPDLTGRALDGVSEWSADDITAFLMTGVNSRTRATGPMAEVVELSTSHLNADDAKAIAAYLKDLPNGASTAAKETAGTATGNSHGRDLYADNCTACHMEKGTGQAGIFPPLKGSAVAQSPDPATAIHLVLSGSHAASTPSNPNRFGMPPFAGKFSDDDVAALLTYVRSAWGNRAGAVSDSQVDSVRKAVATNK